MKQNIEDFSNDEENILLRLASGKNKEECLPWKKVKEIFKTKFEKMADKEDIKILENILHTLEKHQEYPQTTQRIAEILIFSKKEYKNTKEKLIILEKILRVFGVLNDCFIIGKTKS